MQKIAITTLLLMLTVQAEAATYSSRNATSYVLGQYASHTITTHPPQPFQPVYAWRTHVKFDYSLGPLGNFATHIGDTDANGILVIENIIGGDPIYCGNYYSERVAVGSTTSPKSNALNFKIEVSPIGPRPPWYSECRENLGGGNIE